jgi:S-adenosylmethionine:tRNA-ribosyltransferase-isomerase (queuine synthetase)
MTERKRGQVNSPEQGAPSAEDFFEAYATETLNLAEMDKLVNESVAKWAEHDEQKKKTSALYAEAEAIDAKIMDALKKAGKKSYKVDGVGTVGLRATETVRVPATIEAKQKFFAWLKEQKGVDVLYSMTTVNSQTLNSWYKKESDLAAERGEAGFSVPGLDGTSTRETLAFTTDKKKGK